MLFGQKMFYVDYEINPFEKTHGVFVNGVFTSGSINEGFKRYLRSGSRPLAIRDDRPIEAMTEKDVSLFWESLRIEIERFEEE